jgi:hypothetical protein
MQIMNGGRAARGHSRPGSLKRTCRYFLAKSGGVDVWSSALGARISLKISLVKFSLEGGSRGTRTDNQRVKDCRASTVGVLLCRSVKQNSAGSDSSSPLMIGLYLGSTIAVFSLLAARHRGTSETSSSGSDPRGVVGGGCTGIGSLFVW